MPCSNPSAKPQSNATGLKRNFKQTPQPGFGSGYFAGSKTYSHEIRQGTRRRSRRRKATDAQWVRVENVPELRRDGAASRQRVEESRAIRGPDMPTLRWPWRILDAACHSNQVTTMPILNLPSLDECLFGTRYNLEPLHKPKEKKEKEQKKCRKDCGKKSRDWTPGDMHGCGSPGGFDGDFTTPL